MVVAEKAGIQSLALNALNTQALTFDSAKVYLDLCDPSALEENMELFAKTMPNSGDVTYDSVNGEVDFKTINGGVAAVLNADLSDVAKVSNAYNLALLNKYMADLVRDEDNSSLTAALSSSAAEIAKVRIALASHFAPVGSSINDYLQAYEQFPAAREVRFKDAVGDVIAYKASTDALPTIPVGVYTPGTASTKAKLVFSGVDLSAEPYTVSTNASALTAFKFAGATSATTCSLSVIGGNSTIEAANNGVVTGASDVAGNMGLSFASSSTTEAVIDNTGRTYGGVALTELAGVYTAGITASTTPYADIVGTYTDGSASTKAKLVISDVDLSAAPYNFPTSVSGLSSARFAGASANTTCTLSVTGGNSTIEAATSGAISGTSAGPMTLTFAASSATKAVANSTGVFLAAAKAKLVIQQDLSIAPYSIATGTNLANFQFGGANGVTNDVQLTVVSGVSTFEAGTNGAVGGATTSGAMTLSFEASSSTNAVVDATGKFFTSGWVLSSAIKMPQLIDTKVPDTYFLGDNITNSSVIQQAVGYTAALAAYIASEDPDACKYRSEDIKINGTISAETANFLLRLRTGDNTDTFSDATTTEEEVKAVIKGFVKEPTLTAVIAAGGLLSKNVVAGLDGFGAYAETIGFTSGNFQAWDDAMVVAQNPNNEEYIYSASNQYRAKTQSHDNVQYAAAKVLAAEKALGSNGPTTVANVETYVGTSTVVVERADAVNGWVVDTAIKASELYMRAENNYVPLTALTANTFTNDDIVALAKSKGITLSINSTGGTVKTLFTDMGQENESALAEDALESYNTGEESKLSKVASYALSESLATTAGTTNITKLTGLIMGGVSSQVNSQFTFTDQACLVVAAIDILDNVDGYAPLADPIVMKAIAKSGLLRKENNQNAFHPLAGIRFGAKSVSSTGNLNDFQAPVKGVSGFAWSSVSLDEKISLVGKIYNNIIENSGLNFNAAEKAHLIDDLIEDFVGASGLAPEYATRLDQYLDQDVKNELLKEKGSGSMRLSVAPLKLNDMVSKAKDTTLSIADRNRCLAAANVMFHDLTELNSSNTPGTALTAPNSNVITSIASIAPKLDAATAKATLETLLEFGGLSQNDLEVFLQAFYDLGLLDDMEMNTLELSAFSPSDFTRALAGVMANEASKLTQYGANANSTSNVSEMTASYSNGIRGIALNFMPAMNNPAFDRTIFITDINSNTPSFNAQMVALDAFSGIERYINSDLAQALILDGFDDAVLNNGRFIKDIKVNRVIKGSEPTTYID